MQDSQKRNNSKATVCFIVFALLWQIAVGLIYGFFFSYNETAFSNMSNVLFVYPFSQTNASAGSFLADSTQFPFPFAVIALAIILLIVGFSMIAAYIERTTVTGMAFTLLIFAMTVQNFFIFRNFWQRISINNPNGQANFSGTNFSQINYINFGNGLQTSYAYSSASFLDAVGSALAIYAGYTAVIGRIGLTEVFFLTWIGTFLYELNSQLLWRLYIPDNGYPSRAFAYGGALGLISSLVLGKRDLTVNNTNYRSSYTIMALAFLGVVLVWCCYPILVLSSVYESTSGKIVGLVGQVNIWLALSASVIGCYTASAFIYSKFSVHDMVFSSITGAIAFSSSTDINYNPGAATAIGFLAGFVCSLSQTRFKHKINQNGVVDSNSVIFQFLLPSFFAAICSATLSGIGQSQTSFTTFSSSGNSTIFSYPQLKQNTRSETIQGAYQIVGWCISAGIGGAAGLIIGLIYRCTNGNFQNPRSFFNDNILYSSTKIQNNRQADHQPVTYPSRDITPAEPAISPQNKQT